jgi:site-specific DNA recombinase
MKTANNFNKGQKRAILYIRVSTDEQTNGYSPADQEERLIKYCERNDIDIIKIYHEDESARNFEDRPEWQNILSFIKQHKNLVDIILFAKWDRFSRNVAEAYVTIRELAKYNVEPQAMEQPLDFSIPEQKLMLAIYLAAPEVDNDRRALNTFNGMRKGRKEGRWLGNALKGYKNARDEQNKPIMILEGGLMETLTRKAFTDFATGLYTIEELRRKLNKEGFKCARSCFNDLLKNKNYLGKIFIPAYKDEPEQWITGKHEPLVSEEIFYQVQDILKGRKKAFPVKYSAQVNELPLRGFLTCPQCGKNLTGSASKGRSNKYYYYHCLKGCKERQRADYLNEILNNILSSFKMNQESMYLFAEILKQQTKNNNKENKVQIKKINEELDKQTMRLQNARTLMLDGEISAKEYKEMKIDIEEQIGTLNRQKLQLISNDENIAEHLDFCIALLSNLNGIYNVADIHTKQLIIGSIFPEKLIFENSKYRTTKINEAVSLLCQSDKDSNDPKKRKHPIFEMLSLTVPRAGLEPACQ